jgi:hypothetical protein
MIFERKGALNALFSFWVAATLCQISEDKNKEYVVLILTFLVVWKKNST